MKLLKIYFAVLILCLLTGLQSRLSAQTKSTLSVGESLGPNDFANGLLTSENGKFKLSTNTQLLFILNTQNNKNIEILNTNSSQKFITEIKVTKGVVTITSTEMKDPLSNDPGIKEVLAKWGDESKGTVNTKLVMQNNGILTLYAGDSQGGEGMVLWSFEVPDGIR